MSLEALQRDMKIVRNQLTMLLNKQPKETWVGASVVSALTGWKGSSKLRWARENGLVRFDSAKKQYLLESIPEVFITKAVRND